MTDLRQFLSPVDRGDRHARHDPVQAGRYLGVMDDVGPASAPSRAPLLGPYTVVFVLIFALIDTVLATTAGPGTWPSAISSRPVPASRHAGAALLSAGLYLVWPLVLFFPMWAAPLILPHLQAPEQSYALLTTHLLPGPLVGLVLAGMFSHTMAMSSSDANAISAVVVRDILPKLMAPVRLRRPETQALRLARNLHVHFHVSDGPTDAKSFGGVTALSSPGTRLVGTVAIPMILGLLPGSSFWPSCPSSRGLSSSPLFTTSLAAQVDCPSLCSSTS